VMADALRVVLELEGDIRVVGVVEDGAQAIAEAVRLRPDVVVMDVHLASVGGLAATRALLQRWPDARVLVLTTDMSPQLVGESAAAGATGREVEDIADELCISPLTLRTHVQRILHKLGVHSRLEAVALALREGMIE